MASSCAFNSTSSPGPKSPGDNSLLRHAELEAKKVKTTRQIAYSILQLLIGIVLYAPNIQQFLQDSSSPSSGGSNNFSRLSNRQKFCLISGTLLALHAITKLLIIFYNNLIVGKDLKINLSAIQSRLLGLDCLQSSRSKTASTSGVNHSALSETPPTFKTVPNFNKSFDELDTRKLIDESILISDTLPKITQPLINEKFRTPTKGNDRKVSHMSGDKRDAHGRDMSTVPMSPAKSAANRSFLSQDTAELLNSPKFKNIPFSLDASPDSLLVNKNTSFSRLLNDDSMDSDLNDDDEVNGGHSQSNLSDKILNNSSFYSNQNRSFVNSFEDSFNRTRASAGSNLNNISSMSNGSGGGRFVNENAYRNAWNENVVAGPDHAQIKNTITNQLYRISTPPTSPPKHTKISTKESQPFSTEKPKSLNLLNDYHFDFNKYNKVDELKGWLNKSILCPLSKEIKELDKIFKEEGIKPLADIKYDILYNICHDIPDSFTAMASAPMASGSPFGLSTVNSGLGLTTGTGLNLSIGSPHPSSGLEKDEKGFLELTNYRKYLEPYKAKLLRLLPYLAFEINFNFPGLKVKYSLENAIKKVHCLASFGYLSGYNEIDDGQLVSNSLIEYFNSSGQLNPKNWFSDRYITGDNLLTKEQWIKNLNRLDNKEIKSYINDLFYAKNRRNADLSDGQILAWSSVINEICPVLVKTSEGLLVIKDSKTVYNFQSNQATFESWILFFDICKKQNLTNVSKLIPV